MPEVSISVNSGSAGIKAHCRGVKSFEFFFFPAKSIVNYELSHELID
jgi:hypothetical protein